MYKWFFGDSLSIFDIAVGSFSAVVTVNYGIGFGLLALIAGSTISVILRRFT